MFIKIVQVCPPSPLTFSPLRVRPAGSAKAVSSHLPVEPRKLEALLVLGVLSLLPSPEIRKDKKTEKSGFNELGLTPRAYKKSAYSHLSPHSMCPFEYGCKKRSSLLNADIISSAKSVTDFGYSAEQTHDARGSSTSGNSETHIYTYMREERRSWPRCPNCEKVTSMLIPTPR